jgi:hypothetical protein
MTTGKNRIMISRAMSGSVLGGDHTFGAFALALVVRPVPGRALLLGGKLGFGLLISPSAWQLHRSPAGRVVTVRTRICAAARRGRSQTRFCHHQQRRHHLAGDHRMTTDRLL